MEPLAGPMPHRAEMAEITPIHGTLAAVLASWVEPHGDQPSRSPEAPYTPDQRRDGSNAPGPRHGREAGRDTHADQDGH